MDYSPSLLAALDVTYDQATLTGIGWGKGFQEGSVENFNA
jgi:hypothetical protein